MRIVFIAVAILITLSLCLWQIRADAQTPFQTHFKIGKDCLIRGSYDHAVKELTRALEISPGNPDALIERGTAFNQLALYQKAIADFNKALVKDQKNSLALNNRGVSYMRSGQLALAKADFQKAIDLTPDDPFANLNYMGSALCLSQGGQAASKLEAWLKRNNWKGRYAGHAAILATIGFKQKGKTKAVDALIQSSLKKTNRLEWPYPVILYLAGRKKPEEVLEAAKDSDYENTQAHCFIALNQRLSGSKDKSKENFQWLRKFGTKDTLEYWIARNIDSGL